VLPRNRTPIPEKRVISPALEPADPGHQAEPVGRGAGLWKSVTFEARAAVKQGPKPSLGSEGGLKQGLAEPDQGLFGGAALSGVPIAARQRVGDGNGRVGDLSSNGATT
jgi:hypothetical protein